jgi:hypothetical protein
MPTCRDCADRPSPRSPPGGGLTDNVSVADLDPASVIEAVARDPRLRAFTSHGMIETMPARQSRRRLLLDKIAQAFEPGVRYSERRVSLFLGAIHADHATLRRYLVDEDFLSRSDGEYWRSGGTVLPSPASAAAESRQEPLMGRFRSSSFQPAWGPAQQAGWVVSPYWSPVACTFGGSTYVFYLPAGKLGLGCVQVSGSGSMSTQALPQAASAGPVAAAVMDGQITVAYPGQNTVSVLTSSDGQNWSGGSDFAGIATGMYGGLAMCDVSGTQYVMYTVGLPPDDSSLMYVVNSGSGWSQPRPVPNSQYGWNPALATDNQTLFVAFQRGNLGISTGQLAGTTWTGPSWRSNLRTNSQVSLGYIGGTLYLSYWGIDNRPHWETWDPAHQSWTDQSIAVQSTGPVIVTALAGQPSLLFKQGAGAGQQPGTLSVCAVSGTTGGSVGSFGAFASDTPPLLVPYGGLTYAFSTLAANIYQHTFDGANWPPPVPVTIFQAGRGRLGADVRLNKDGTQTLWLIAAEPDGQVSVATFDGATWTELPDVMPAGAGQGAVALAVYGGSVYAFFEGAQHLFWAVYDDATHEWIKGSYLPAIGWAGSTSVTVVGETLYVGYLCADPNRNTGRMYTAAFNGESWQAPLAEGTDTATSVTIGSFDKTLIMVFLGTDQNVYAQWSDSGGASWNGKVKLGPASTAPGLAPVTVTVGKDTVDALLAVAASATPGYTGEYSWLMTAADQARRLDAALGEV